MPSDRSSMAELVSHDGWDSDAKLSDEWVSLTGGCRRPSVPHHIAFGSPEAFVILYTTAGFTLTPPLPSLRPHIRGASRWRDGIS
jgi:hypothetical protein